MFYYSHIIILVSVLMGEISCFNMSQLLTSSYAQVSRNNKNEGRSRSSGQTPWTHRSDVHVMRGQNLHKLKNKNDNIGEVLQDRFISKPWFGYDPNNNKGPTYIPPPNTNNNKAPSGGQDVVPFDSFPLSLKPEGPSNQDQDNKNTYGSTYTSYDPPPALNPKNPDNFVTPPEKTIKPPKYLPPEEPDNNPPETPPPDSSDVETGPPISQSYDHPYPVKYEQIPKYPAYLDHDPTLNNYYGHHFYPHDHPPIYHEIKTTTEAPAEDNQRLNKKPYSYYYLGRKLWYIPLYFSVYFIIYIFVLILKSIARHKITFNHYFEEDKREMKEMPPPHDHDHVQELGDHIWDNIHAARRKYIM